MNLMDFNTTGQTLFAAPSDPVNQNLADDIVGSIPADRFANLETMDFGQLVNDNRESLPAGTPRHCAAACCRGGEIVATAILALAAIGAWVVIKRIVES